MSKLLTLLLTTAAAVGLAQAQCTPNAYLCGPTIIDEQQCSDETSLAFLAPEGNSPRNCAFPTDPDGLPIARGVFCCAAGRCVQSGSGAFCD